MGNSSATHATPFSRVHVEPPHFRAIVGVQNRSECSVARKVIAIHGSWKHCPAVLRSVDDPTPPVDDLAVQVECKLVRLVARMGDDVSARFSELARRKGRPKAHFETSTVCRQSPQL